MEAYKVIKPANLQELDATLRTNPLGSEFPITIEGILMVMILQKEEVLFLRKRKLPFQLLLLMLERAVKILE